MQKKHEKSYRKRSWCEDMQVIESLIVYRAYFTWNEIKKKDNNTKRNYLYTHQMCTQKAQTLKKTHEKVFFLSAVAQIEHRTKHKVSQHTNYFNKQHNEKIENSLNIDVLCTIYVYWIV